MKVNQATVDLVKKKEGFKAKAYLCPAGVWTIGYGTTARAGIGVDVQQGMTISEKEAERLLRLGLERFASQIRPMIKQPINDNQFGAFLSLAYNIGPSAFSKSSALRHFNGGDNASATQAMRAWNKARVKGKLQVLQGLVNRREDEIKLFNTPVSATVTSQPEKTNGGFWAIIEAILKRLFG
jgi:lysozyme